MSPIELPNVYGWVEIFCLAVIFYYVFFFLRGTRGAPMLVGLVLVLVGLVGATRLFRLDALNWLLSRISVYLAVAVLIIFQPEIRRALTELGQRHFFGNILSNRTLVEEIIEAVILLARRRIGALIAIEQSIGTRPVQESGVQLDCAVTAELLAGIFEPHAPMHDGGVIIAGDRIVAGRCTFPLTQQYECNKALGTRHRAALGLSDETDAVILVVSEETGVISVAYKGNLMRNLDEEKLRRFLTELWPRDRKAGGLWKALRRSRRRD